MKRILSLALITIAAVLSSCQKAPELTLTGSASIELSEDGGSGSITFTANRDWEVSCSDSWVSVSPSSGTASDGPVTVSVRCNANTTYEDRTATVTIRMEELTQTVTIRQAGRIPVVSVELNQTALSLKPGETATLVATIKPDNATDKTVTWTSTNVAAASVDDKGKVTAVKDGNVMITARAGEKSATCSVEVYTVPEGAVDLGIIMTREDGSSYRLFWADRNIRASMPEEYGEYYAWGETSPKNSYTWMNYKFWTSGDSWDNVQFSKYNTKDSYGPVDNKTTLDPEDDAAHIVLGGNWRIPTEEEWMALRTECTWTWATLNGANGYIVESKSNSNSIFLPEAGSCADLLDSGSFGYYWSSSLVTVNPDSAFIVHFRSDAVLGGHDYRFFGQSIRPVSE